MTPGPTNAEKVRKLPWGLSGDALNTMYVYLTFGGSPFLLFLDRLGLDKTQIGVVLSLFPFAAMIGLITVPVAARVGFRRMFLTFWIARKLVLSLLLLAPWVVSSCGLGVGFAFVVGVLTVFALCRSVAESAFTPWYQDIVPDSMRGKYAAIQVIVVSAIGALTLGGIGLFLGAEPTLGRFGILHALATFLGLASAFMYARLPGGGPAPGAGDIQFLANLMTPLRNPNFRRFVLGGAVVNFGWLIMGSFLPLFMRNQVGLPSDHVVFLDSVVLLASLSASFLWGWAADRFGGKPVMVMNLAMLSVYPLGLLLLPRHSPLSTHAAVALSFAIGLISSGWGIGYARYFAANLIPAGNRSAYTAMHGAIIGLVQGVCPIIAGSLLNLTGGFDRTFLGVMHWDPYAPFFLFAILCVAASTWAMSGMPTAGAMPVGRFATLFMQGNPLVAMRAVLTNQFVGHEENRISMIARLGEAKSPLGVDELIEALEDPAFNVRYEAIISIARTLPDPRLTEAMIRVLREGDPDLRSAAAWALGRMGNVDAAPALRETLHAPYSLLRARAARALGTLGDQASGDALMEGFRNEADPQIRLAYISAMAALGRDDVLSPALAFLRELKEPGPRREVSLAVAMFLGRNDQALRIWRRMHDHPGDTLGGIMLGLRRRLTRPEVCGLDAHSAGQAIDRCVRALGAEEMGEGAREIRLIGGGVRPEAFSHPAQIILRDALEALASTGHERTEYIMLAVHSLHVGIKPEFAAM
ncbi:MAG: MFS transporter [Planctomycetota bacterium]|nr:MFS transporter [Planctomycetota bacterium]